MMKEEEVRMNLTKQNLEAILKQACANVGESLPVEVPTAVAQEFARLVVHQNQSDLRTAGCVISPPLQILLSMGAVAGPPDAVADLKRGYDLLAQAL